MYDVLKVLIKFNIIMFRQNFDNIGIVWNKYCKKIRWRPMEKKMNGSDATAWEWGTNLFLLEERCGLSNGRDIFYLSVIIHMEQNSRRPCGLPDLFVYQVAYRKTKIKHSSIS